MNHLSSTWSIWTPRILAVLGLSAILLVAGITYGRGYTYPPCCDTAITLSKAQQIVRTHSLNPLLIYNPSFPEVSYGSLFSTEFGAHIFFIIMYWLMPATIGSLVAAKYMFLAMLLLAIASFWLASYKLSRSWTTALVATLLYSLSYGLGVSFWQGHVAEWIGCGLIPWAVVAAQHWWGQPSWRRLIPWAIVLMALFFAHALSFLTAFVTSLAVVTHRVWQLDRSAYRWRSAVGISLTLILGLAYFRFSRSTLILPLIDTRDQMAFSFDVLLKYLIGAVPLIPALVFGWLRIIRRKQVVILYWAVLSYLLSQASFIGTPFFSYRFAVFLFLPLAYIVAEGVSSLQSRFGPALRILLPALMVAIYIPQGISLQYQYRQCYIQNCEGLHPTQVTASDIAAFSWMKQNLPTTAVIAAHSKFGYYIPITTGLKTELPVLRKRLIFTDPDPAVRAQVVKEFHIDYIFWDDIFVSGTSILEAADYTRQPLDNPRYFQKMYDHGAVIYAAK